MRNVTDDTPRPSADRVHVPTSSSHNDDDGQSRAIGASYGVAGFAGVFSWLNRSNTRNAIDSVSPMTARGTMNVLLWCVLVALVGIAGLLIAPGFGPRWFGVALVAMLPVAWWWSWRDRQTDG